MNNPHATGDPMTRLIELAKNDYGDLLVQLYNAGIQAVSQANWATLKSTAALIEQPDFAVLQVHQRMRRLKSAFPHEATVFRSQPLREIIHWARLTQRPYREWQAQQITRFNDPLWWHQQLESVKTLPVEAQPNASNVLVALQKKWLLQRAYAHYSTLDVLHVYETVMPVFSEWLHYAKTELKKQGDQLNPALKSDYQRYLTWFENALREEKSVLRGCLHERLAVGLKKGYGAWDNVIEGMRAELKAIDLLPREPKLEKALAYGHLTPEAFVSIRQILEKDGSTQEKRALQALAYDRLSFDNRLYFVQHNTQNLTPISLSRSQTMSMKSTLYPYLPRFLQWLFWDEEVRAHFFEHPHCQFLLAQETALLNAKADVSTLTIETLSSCGSKVT